MLTRDSISRVMAAAVLLVATVPILTAQPAQPADPAGDIRGPKPVIEIPVPEEPPVALWAGVGGGVVFLSAAVVGWLKFLRRKEIASPGEKALAELGGLESEGESIGAETFAFMAAKTVRQYIADRFGIAAPRRSTEEFFRDLSKQDQSPLLAESEHLRAFLKSCDLAKFAGVDLDATRRAELLRTARDFVRATSTAPETAKGGKP